MSKHSLNDHGTVFDCGPVMSNAKAGTVPGQFYFGGTAAPEHLSKRCSQCAHYRVKPVKGSKPKNEGNALKKGPRQKEKGVCQKHREAMKRALEFEGQNAVPCKYFEEQEAVPVTQ